MDKFGGWAVAATAFRETDTKWQVRTRPFTVATFHREDAERYAQSEMEKDFPATDGWHITVSAKTVRIIGIEPENA